MTLNSSSILSESSSVLSVERVKIDPRSFHVFSTEGLFFLFDRATGTLSEIDIWLHEVLKHVEDGTPSDTAIKNFADENEVPADTIFEAVSALQVRGFFRFSPIDLSQQEFLTRKLWFHKPRRIQLLMAQGCNLGCRYCYAWRNGSNQLSTLMPWDTAKQSIDYLVERSAHRTELHITFFGGEPLLNWEILVRAVDYAKLRGRETGKTFVFEVITNGTLLTEERANFLADNNFILMVSIDGWKEMHDYNRPTLGEPSTYETIVKNALYVNNLYKSRGMRPIKIRANLTHKFQDYFSVFQHLRSIGFERVAVAPIEPLPHGDQSPSAMTEDDMDRHAEIFQEKALEILHKIGGKDEITEMEREIISDYAGDRNPQGLKGLICGVGRNTSCVDHKGNIYPCHRYEGMSAFVIGNVYTGHDEEKTMRYYRMVNGNATDRCHSCWIRDYCAGGCAWLLSTKQGTIVDPTVRECNRRRRNFENGLFIRSQLRAATPELFANSSIDIDEWNFDSVSDADSKGSASKCGSTCGCS